uniref:Transporter n=1 Tax=Caenorhabditis tropicalis TaxID=1561998 RepID=A0A1I7UCC9_9PELO
MFISLSYTTHTIISISLHVLGVVVGLFVWYLFPKHPTRSIVQLPSERVAVSIDTPITTKSEKLNAFSPASPHNFTNNNDEKVGKLIDFDDHHLPQISAIRQFG